MTTLTTAPMALWDRITRLGQSQKRHRLLIGAVVGIATAVPLAFGYGLWPFVVAGISDGAIYALAAMGLVLTYKTSGIVNFAIGAQAAASAYLFYTLRMSLGLPWPIAALLALLCVGVGGALVLERIAYWLSDAQPVMKVVATIGILVLLQSVLKEIYGSTVIQIPSFLPNAGIHIGGVAISGSEIIITILALVASAGLYVFFKKTRVGVAMQAVVEDPALVALHAISPVRIRRYAWVIGSSFVSISGVLIAPQLGIYVDLMLLFYITAFGAAAAASFSSLPGTFAAALGIGVAMNVLSDKLSSGSTFVSELYTQVPFFVLVLALVFLPRSRLIGRGSRQARRFQPIPRFPLPVVGAAVVAGVGFACAIPALVGHAYINQYSTTLGFAIVFGSLGLLLWTSGQISLCQIAFAAVGATTFAHAQHAGLPWIVALIAAGLMALPVGALVAIPSFRLSGLYLALATLGFGLLFQNLIYNTFVMFGGASTVDVARPKLFGLATDQGYYYVALSIAIICFVIIVAVHRSRFGRLLRGLADSAVALEAHGTNTKLTRLFVFCISAFLAAIGGAVIAGATQAAGGASSGPFGYVNSLVLVAVLAICRRQPVLSPVIAAVVFELLRVYKPFNDPVALQYQGVIFGSLAIGVAVLPAITARIRVGRTSCPGTHRA